MLGANEIRMADVMASKTREKPKRRETRKEQEKFGLAHNF